jgi:hypothetical protein
MKADWTNPDDAIAVFLARYGKSAVPFYVLYRPGREPHVFSEILTRQQVLDALAEAAPFLGTAVGFALAQEPALIFAISPPSASGWPCLPAARGSAGRGELAAAAGGLDADVQGRDGLPAGGDGGVPLLRAGVSLAGNVGAARRHRGSRAAEDWEVLR